MISLFEQSKSVWVPRKRLGEDKTLTQIEKDILDGVDIQEQKVDFAMKLAVRAWNLSILLAIFFLLINGVRIVQIVQKWAGHSPIVMMAERNASNLR